MNVSDLIEAIEGAAIAQPGDAHAAVCYMIGTIERAAESGDRVALRAYAALTKIAGRPEWVGDDGRPVSTSKEME